MENRIDNRFLTETLQKLVKINSVNPHLEEGAPGEKEIAIYLKNLLQNLDIEIDVEELKPGRFNVTGIINGSGEGPSLMINAHTDTVGVRQVENPFSGRISNGKLFGRGSMDMKGSIAAMVAMAKSLKDNDIELQGDLILAFVADEEFASLGTERLLVRYHTDGAIVTEPTGLDLCTAHKGFGLYEVTTKGMAAHGSRPEKGIDAIMQMARFLGELDRVSERLNNLSPHPLLGNSSMHVPVINGGTEPFTYAASCKINLERRTLPGETSLEILSELKEIIKELTVKYDDFNAEITEILWRDAFEANLNSELVKKLHQSVATVTGKEPDYIGHPWWEDSGLISKNGIDTIIIGPNGEGLHSPVEWVEVASVIDLAEILLDVSITFCNNK